MADEVVPAGLTDDDVRAFFDAKNVKIKCELCDATSWLVYPQSKSEEMRVVMVICANCGHLRRHLSSAIDRWKAKGF